MVVDLVGEAIRALHHLGVDNRDDAYRLLSMYARRHELSGEQVREVLDAFPASGAPRRS